MAEPEVSNPAAVRGFVEGGRPEVASLSRRGVCRGVCRDSMPRSFAWERPRAEVMARRGTLIGGGWGAGVDAVEVPPPRRELPAAAWNAIRAAPGRRPRRGSAQRVSLGAVDDDRLTELSSGRHHRPARGRSAGDRPPVRGIGGCSGPTRFRRPAATRRAGRGIDDLPSSSPREFSRSSPRRSNGGATSGPGWSGRRSRS